MFPKTKTAGVLIQIAVVLSLLLIWQAMALVAPSPALPPITDVLSSAVKLVVGEGLLTVIFPSVWRLTVGLLLGVAVGIVVGLTIGFAKSLEPWVRPFLEFFRAVPAVALLPGAILLFGATDAMRVFVIALGCMFPVLLSSIDGARRTDALMLETARVLGHSKTKVLIHVVVKSAWPTVFAGIRISMAIALIMMVISELIAANDGIGYFIQQSQRLFRTVDVYAGVIIIGVLGLLYTTAMLRIEQRVLRWHRGWRGVLD